MFFLQVFLKNKDGEGVTLGNPYNLVLISVQYPSTQMMDMGEYASYAAAKSFAATVFVASLTWDDTTMTSDAFTA